MTHRKAIEDAAATISRAEALLIAAGAGMGVDSGLSAIRGPSGFAAGNPAFARLGLGYDHLVNPAIFERDPHLAWGFHGRSLQLYRATQPHAGFALLRRWATARPAGAFVYTSNVDGQFQKAGFDAERVIECHGTAHVLQCARLCGDHTWPAAEEVVRLDASGTRAIEPLPRCPRCGGVARPNVRMFRDGSWVGHRTAGQSARYEAWKAAVAGRSVAVIECGAGTAVPAVRLASEWAILQLGATLIRIDPSEPDVPSGHIAIAAGALDALVQIGRALGDR